MIERKQLNDIQFSPSFSLISCSLPPCYVMKVFLKESPYNLKITRTYLNVELLIISNIARTELI